MTETEEKPENRYCPIKDGYCNTNCRFCLDEECLIEGALAAITIGFDDLKKELKKINKELAKVNGIRFIRR